MPEPIADAQAAASSAAAAQPPTAPVDSLESLNEDQLQEWRMTGKFPDSSSVTDAAAASSTAEPAAQVASTDASPTAASEPAKPATPTPGADKRIPELLADRARERDRAERAEARIRELERTHQPPADVKPAASSPAPAGPVEPDPEQFPYGTADPGYVRAVAKYETDLALANARTKWENDQAAARAKDEAARVMAGFEERAKLARGKHADFDAVALLAPTQIPQGSAVDLWILEDDAGAEILYHLQQPANAAELTRILSLGPLQQMKELARLGDRLTGPAPAPRTTAAPPPPPVLSSRPTPADPVDAALADGDDDAATGRYLAAANARDLARLKGR